MTNPRLSQRLVDAGLQRVESSSMRSLAEKYVSIYEEAIDIGRGRSDDYATRIGGKGLEPTRMLRRLDRRRLGRQR